MLFTDINFICFLLPVWIAFIILNHFKFKNAKNSILLIASYIFYGMFSPTYLISLFYVTLINFIFSRYLIHKRSKGLTALVIVLTLCPLFFYKYTHFIVSDVLMMDDTLFNNILLPVGISFFTFQALSHTIDTYQGKIQETPKFLNFALFISFFPTILSGPIERSRTLLPQIDALQKISSTEVLNGIQLFLWGLLKKVVVANRLSVYIDGIYANPHLYGGNTVLFAMTLYSIQIYCDFSGYSDMAIGIGRIFGFNLCKNFNFPYFSTSIRSFWRKWHISLTTWFTEYIYFCMGGNRVTKERWIINVLIVFLVSGIWHGAAWTFIVWGLIHGLLQITEHYSIGKCEFNNKAVQILLGVGLFILVTIAWVFFRAPNMETVHLILTSACTSWEPLFKGASIASFLLMICAIFIFTISEILLSTRYVKITEIDDNPFGTSNLCFLIIVILAICLLGKSGANFVYFQF